MADPQFEVLMRALMSPHNEDRKAAEAQFEALIRTPMQAAPLMCGAMENSGDMTVRSMATVMFRKRVSEEFYGQLPPEMQVTRALLPSNCQARAASAGLIGRLSARMLIVPILNCQSDTVACIGNVLIGAFLRCDARPR